MASKELEALGKTVVQFVRDLAIQFSDMGLRPDVQSASARRWREASRTGDLAAIIPDIVDETLFYLFDLIDNNGLSLTYRTEDGQVVDLTKDGLGELAGWYVGDWIYRYSDEQFGDDQAGLKGRLDLEDVDPRSYSLFGERRDNSHVIEETPSGWLVYYYERGGRDDIHLFPSESEACVFLWRKLRPKAREQDSEDAS